MVAHLFNAPEDGDEVGASTIGSSEAVMLAGLAMKWRWRARREASGEPTDKPNMILGSNVRVVWEKSCRYWDVEARYIPVHEGRYVISPEEAVERIDENTIGVVAILGTTYTGEFEPIEAIHDAVVASNAETGFDVPVHVDAASGGFVAPFLHPALKVGLPPPDGEVDQRLGAQVRTDVPRVSASSCGATRKTCPKIWSSM